MATCSVFGHAKHINYNPYISNIRTVFTELITKNKVDTFYSGGRGLFDYICRDILFELSQTYKIKSYLILSYMPTTPIAQIEKYNGGSLYLLETFVPPKYAILKTNKIMVNMSNYIVTGVIYTYGGAFSACEYAMHKNKVIISVI